MADLSPQQLVAAIDFSYCDEVLTEQQAILLLEQTRPSVEQRAAEMEQRGYPAYTTSVGWSGYSPERVEQLCAAAQAEGFNAFKMKVPVRPCNIKLSCMSQVGLGEEEDQKKAGMMRELLGWDAVRDRQTDVFCSPPHCAQVLMMDANSVWGVDEAIEQMGKLAKFRPYWIEEPTSPDDIVGHAAIAKVALAAGRAQGSGAGVGRTPDSVSTGNQTMLRGNR